MMKPIFESLAEVMKKLPLTWLWASQLRALHRWPNAGCRSAAGQTAVPELRRKLLRQIAARTNSSA